MKTITRKDAIDNEDIEFSNGEDEMHVFYSAVSKKFYCVFNAEFKSVDKEFHIVNKEIKRLVNKYNLSVVM